MMHNHYQGGDKLTLNLSGVDQSESLRRSPSPTVTKPINNVFANNSHTYSNNLPLLPSPTASCAVPEAALITFHTPPQSPVVASPESNIVNGPQPTHTAEESRPVSETPNNSNNVTVTHFSEQRGGVVEKISVPSPNIFRAELAQSPKLDNKTKKCVLSHKIEEQLNQLTGNSSHDTTSSMGGTTFNKNPFINMTGMTPVTPLTKNPFLSNNAEPNGAATVEDNNRPVDGDGNDITMKNNNNIARDATFLKNPFRGSSVGTTTYTVPLDKSSKNTVCDDKTDGKDQTRKVINKTSEIIQVSDKRIILYQYHCHSMCFLWTFVPFIETKCVFD